MIVETIRTVAGIAALRADYDRLCRVASNKLPFALHEWHIAWCEHFLNCNPRIQEQALFYVVRNDERECVAIVPFVSCKRMLGPLKILSVNFLGADPAITEIRAPLIETGYEEIAARAVQDHLAREGAWDWVDWTDISDAFGSSLDTRQLHWQQGLSAYVLDLPRTWPEFQSGLKRNIRESLRHCYNSLKRDGHCFECAVIDRPEDIGEALDEFLRLHVMRADYKTSVIHPNRFSSRVSRDFLYSVCRQLAARGAVRIFQLRIGAKIVATRIGFVVGDSLYLYYSGFDPEWARYGVMTTTVAEAIKYAIAQGLATVNLSPTKDISKTRWGPREVTYRSAYQQGARLRSRLVHRAYLKTRSAKGIQAWILQLLIPARRTWS
ncbi:MAG TPA: GNAT family N-acetyltransferase [Steroidobacteraceae bacterium]|nr:GNAT family N-acetyltransferase [Steroidobacteraceae bacterium]